MWSKKLDDAAIFIPFHEGCALKTRGVRVDYDLEVEQGQILVQRAIRYSNDGGKTWTAATGFGAAFNGTAGWHNDTQFHAVDEDYQQFQVGLNVMNDEGVETLTSAMVDMILALSPERAVGVAGGVQAWDAGLDAIASLSVADDNFIVGDGTSWTSESGADARASLGLVISTDVQAWDVDLDTYAANPLTAAILGELQNIGIETISGAQWGWLGSLDQALATTDWPSFLALTLTGGNVVYADAYGPYWSGDTRIRADAAGPLGVYSDTDIHLNADDDVGVWVGGAKCANFDGGTQAFCVNRIDDHVGGSIGIHGAAVAAFDVYLYGDMGFAEQAAAPAVAATQLGLWAKNDTPNRLYFTDDAAADHKVLSDQDIGVTVQAYSADLDTYSANPLTEAELGELQNIGATTISAAQWGYLGILNQSLTTGSSPLFNNLYLTDTLIHFGDTDTYLDFGTNQVDIWAGGVDVWRATTAGTAVTGNATATGYFHGRSAGSAGAAFRIGDDLYLHDINVAYTAGLQGISGSGSTHAALRFGSAGAYLGGSAGKIGVSSSSGYAPNSLFDVNGTCEANDFLLPSNGDLHWSTVGNATHIYGTPTDLYVEADDDLFLRPDDDVYVAYGTTNWMRMDGTSKHFGIGTHGYIAPGFLLQVSENVGSGYVAWFYNVYSSNADVVRITTNDATPTTGAYLIEFRDGGGNIGEVRCDGTGVDYIATSDERLKQNIRPATGCLERALEIPVKQFTWKRDPDRETIGFTWQSLLGVGWREGVIPAADIERRNARPRAYYQVRKGKPAAEGRPSTVRWEDCTKILGPGDLERLQADRDKGMVRNLTTAPIDENDDDWCWGGIDNSKLVPLLFGALQAEVAERRAEAEQLREEMRTLEARIAALEAR
ncbi:MAG: tail fiber domain-containing protein [Deltaproteobacteria bacterium]|nr:tail fiber domain-containing protein [Deltaproteobacteria bacterium]